MSNPRPEVLSKGKCECCGWQANEYPLSLYEVWFGEASWGDGKLTYWLELCAACFKYAEMIEGDPRWSMSLRVDRGFIKERIDGLRRRIAELEAASA